MDMSPPRSIKEVQKLAGRLAALNRFISRSVDKGLPFFKILRGIAKFEWNETSQEAFDTLKRYLVSLPLLTKPMKGETLYLYMVPRAERGEGGLPPQLEAVPRAERGSDPSPLLPPPPSSRHCLELGGGARRAPLAR
ncbi:UNVERIFIED_CONTAM: hypothetical protein Slati_0163000 [Sesamum latifolium]|uniref:Reverse transcriptase/retrotransposon-derived protein RNase H-like domain-containing protein n=1 Tax=Sesamum latifolium TaxID=2727402 RepID=A0AAW2YAI7_9LAMI